MSLCILLFNVIEWYYCRKGKSSTALIAALDGAIHLVDSNSMKIIWSFSSGPPIYSSYQANIKPEHNQENASGVSRSFFFDCGDDWELYIHTEHGKMVKSSELITPIMLMCFVSAITILMALSIS